MDYYSILEVNPTSSEEVVQMAYKALAKKYHPDLYEGDKKFAEEKMKEINIAYSVLSDPELRKQYESEFNANRGSSEDTEATQNKETQQSYRGKSEDIYKNDQYNHGDGCAKSFFKIIWGIVKIGLAIFIVYNLFTGNLKSMFTNVKNGISNIGNSTVQSVSSVREPEIASGAQHAVTGYLQSLKNMDLTMATQYIKGDKLNKFTAKIIEMYQKGNDINEFAYKILREAKTFTYKADYVSESAGKATVDVNIKAKNLYAVATLAAADLTEKLKDEDWITDYAIDAALKGETSTDDMQLKLLEKIMYEYLDAKIDKLDFTIQFVLENENGAWKISDVTNPEDFISALTGNFDKVAAEIQNSVQTQ